MSDQALQDVFILLMFASGCSLLLLAWEVFRDRGKREWPRKHGERVK